MTLCGSDNSVRPQSSPPPYPRSNPARHTRFLLGALAVSGTVAYAASFRTVPSAPGSWLAPAATAVGAAAGASWMFFGAALVLATLGRTPPLEWADACLRTMGSGIVVLTAGAAFNVAAALVGHAPLGLVLGVHALVLASGNVVMGVSFVRAAARLGLKPRPAVAAWVCALDGPFVLIVMFFYRIGAFKL